MPIPSIPQKSRAGCLSKLLTLAKSLFRRASRSTSPLPSGKVASLSPSSSNPIPVISSLPGPPTPTIPPSALDSSQSAPMLVPSPTQHLPSSNEDVDVYQKLLPRTLTDAKSSPQTVLPDRKLPGLGSTSWNVLKQTLKITQDLSDNFLPLHMVVTGLLVIMDHIEKVDDVRTDFADIASRIEALNSLLEQYQHADTALPFSIRTRLEKFTGAMNLQNEAIKEKIRRGVLKRTLDASSDSKEIVQVLQTLSNEITFFTLDTALNTDINVERMRTQIDQRPADILVQESNQTEQYEDVNINDILSPVKSALCDPEGFPEEYKCCLPGTRENALSNAVDYIKSALIFGYNQRLWLTGVAGSGKTTISTTLVSTLRKQDITVATFFCKRDQVDRRNPRLVIPTLAWYLASTFPEFRKSLGPALNESMNGRKALPSHPAGQLETLLLSPLRHLASLATSSPIVILIDALDETDELSRHLLVDALVDETTNIPAHVVVVLVSRRSRDLQKKLQSFQILLDLDRHLHDPSADHDIRLYLEDRLQAIREEQEEEPDWPSEFEVSSLAKRADGLFIWAVIACNFIEQPSCRDELSRLLRTNVAVGIDDLYAHTLGSEFSKLHNKAAWIEDYRTVMGCIISSLSPLIPEDIALLIGRSLNVVNSTLRILEPLLYRDEERHVRLVHASLADYLLDENRSQQLWIAHSYLHLSLARGCLNALIECSSGLTLDLRRLASPSTFIHLTSDSLSTHVRYSCISWVEHLVQAQLDDSETSEIAQVVETFLKTSFLSWLEILSLLGNVSPGVHALTLLCSWTKAQGTLQDLALDSLKFLETFRIPIQSSTAHIYISALPWAPPSSQIANIYRDQLDPQRNFLPVIRSGLSSDWPSDDVFKKPVLVPMEKGVSLCHLVFSPDGSLVAQVVGKELRVWETLNGTLVFGPLSHTSDIMSIGISPNNMFIASATTTEHIQLNSRCSSSSNLFPVSTERTQSNGDAGSPSSLSPDAQRIEEGHAPSFDSSPETFLELTISPITAPTKSSVFRRSIKHVFSEFVPTLLAFSEDSSQLRITSMLDDTLPTWDIESGEPIESSKHKFESTELHKNDNIVFEPVGWLLRKKQSGLSEAYCFIPWYDWPIKLGLFQKDSPAAFHARSCIAVLFLCDNPIIIQFPKEWKIANQEILQATSEVDLDLPIPASPPLFPTNHSSSGQAHATPSSNISICTSSVSPMLSPSLLVPPLYPFDISESAVTQRYQSILRHMRYAELSENFADEFSNIMVSGSTVEFFKEDPVSLPFVHVQVHNLPSAISMWVSQQDQGNSGERLQFKFIPCQESDGTRHFIVCGQRGFWPIYIVYDVDGNKWLHEYLSDKCDGTSRSRTSLDSRSLSPSIISLDQD